MHRRDEEAAVLVVEDELAVADAVVSRFRAVLRRVREPGGTIGSGGMQLDVDRRRVRHREQPIRPTPTELDPLRARHDAAGAVLTWLQLPGRVWGSRDGSGTRTVDSHVRSIRHETDDDIVRTVHGVGYGLGRPDELVPGPGGAS